MSVTLAAPEDFTKTHLLKWAIPYLRPAINKIEDFAEDVQVLGFKDDKGIAAVVIYDRFNGFDMHMSIASKSDAEWANFTTLRQIFAHPFLGCNCSRVTAFTTPDNEKSMKLLEQAGFKKEGVQRLACLGTQDLLAYGMLRHECKWIYRNGKK